MSVTVIIAGYNAEPWLERCLQSCRESVVPTRVILVDNASSDRTLEIAREFPEVLTLPQSKNLGFGAANNIGLQKAREENADWVLLLNQDAFLEPRTLTHLLASAERHPEIGVFSPLHLAGDGVALDPPFTEHLQRGAPQFLSDLHADRLKDHYRVPFVNAAIWLIRRETLDRVGGFDPLFFLYGEDDDWCARAERLGIAIAVIPVAHAIHARGGESGSADRKRQVAARANRIYLTHVLAMKRPDRAAWRSFAGATLETLTRTVRLAFSGMFGEATAAIRGYWRMVFRLPEILRHRALCRGPGPHWI
jgi:GT2 family glycosyltransferase